MEPSTASTQALQDTDDYLVFDPRATRARGPAQGARQRSQFQEGIVFVVGGGGYVEYGNLTEWAARQPGGKNVVYGSTEVLSPTAFVKCLAELGASR